MPVVAVAPELVAVVILAVLLCILLVNVQLYQNGKQARAYAVNLPIVADLAVTAIDFLIGFDVQAARVIDQIFESVLVSSAQAFANLIVAVFNAAGAALLALIHNTASVASIAYTVALQVEYTELPAVRGLLSALAATERADIAAVRVFILSSLNAATLPILARLADLGFVVGQQQQVIDAYSPLWAQLAAVPNGAADSIARLKSEVAVLTTAVGALQGALGQAQSGISVLERQVAVEQSALARLAAVGVIAGAGDVVIAEILRIAENPCEVCPGLNLNDLEGRVASMELAGV